MTLAEVLARLPAELRQWGIVYGPALLRMAGDELTQCLLFIGAKDDDKAFAMIVHKMTETELVAEMETLGDVNDTETAAVAARRSAAFDVAKALVSILLTLAVGL